MGVIRYDITEEAFQEKSLPLTELSILTGMDSSSYLITGPKAEVLAIRAFSHSSAEPWWNTDERLNQGTFSKVRLAWQSRRFTLVPARLYDGEQRRSFLTTLTKLTEQETVLADALPALDAFLVYAVEQQRLTTWRRAFVGCRFYHVLTPLLGQVAQLAQQIGRPSVFAYLRDGNIFTIGIDRNQLLFCNSFACPEAKDGLYYVLLTYQQCGWKTNQVPLYLIGEIMTDAEIYRLLYRYVKQVNFIADRSGLNWGSSSATHPVHLFYDLAALQQHH